MMFEKQGKHVLYNRYGKHNIDRYFTHKKNNLKVSFHPAYNIRVCIIRKKGFSKNLYLSKTHF